MTMGREERTVSSVSPPYLARVTAPSLIEVTPVRTGASSRAATAPAMTRSAARSAARMRSPGPASMSSSALGRMLFLRLRGSGRLRETTSRVAVGASGLTTSTFFLPAARMSFMPGALTTTASCGFAAHL